MPNELSYLRFPSVRGDLLAFVADDDVFLAPAAGGTARRLTADHAPASFTRLSPDGSLVAYTSQRDGLPEVLVVATDGTDLRRLTFLGDRFTRTIGWTDDGRVLAISAAGEPFRSRTWAYALPVDGSPTARSPRSRRGLTAPSCWGSTRAGRAARRGSATAGGRRPRSGSTPPALAASSRSSVS